MLQTPWFLAKPTKLTLLPLDHSAIYVDVSGELFQNQLQEWDLGPLGEFRFVASPALMHLFVITCFLAFVAPFGSFFVTGLKKALKADTLGSSFYSGGVSDRLDVVLILGLFFMIYINAVIY